MLQYEGLSSSKRHQTLAKMQVPGTIYAAVRIETGAATMEISMEIVQKTKNGNTTQPSRSPLSTYLNESKPLLQYHRGIKRNRMLLFAGKWK